MNYPNLSSLGEQAAKADNTPSFGYSPHRWVFWKRRLQGLSQEIHEDAETCANIIVKDQQGSRIL